MSRPSKPHEHRGKWRVRVEGVEYDPGTDRPWRDNKGFVAAIRKCGITPETPPRAGGRGVG